MSKPPVLSSVASTGQNGGNGISYDEPITHYESSSMLWSWKDKVVNDERLQSLEQLFYFATARKLVNTEHAMYVILFVITAQ